MLLESILQGCMLVYDNFVQKTRSGHFFDFPVVPCTSFIYRKHVLEKKLVPAFLRIF
jgi:hypothetical protein